MCGTTRPEAFSLWRACIGVLLLVFVRYAPIESDVVHLEGDHTGLPLIGTAHCLTNGGFVRRSPDFGHFFDWFALLVWVPNQALGAFAKCCGSTLPMGCGNNDVCDAFSTNT